MKFIIRLFATFTALVFVLVTVIKLVQRCSYKEAVGIVEEIWKEVMRVLCDYQEDFEEEIPEKVQT